jgi:multisubunit Na+/H+ antiporter MnhB subunit
MSRWPWFRNVAFAAAALLGVATVVLYWTMRDDFGFSEHPKRMGAMVALVVAAVGCAVAGILLAQRAARRDRSDPRPPASGLQ